MSELSKLDALLHKTCIKVLRLDMCTSMISLSKIAHQMWRDHPFSRIKKDNRMSSGVGGWRRQGREIGGPFYQLCLNLHLFHWRGIWGSHFGFDHVEEGGRFCTLVWLFVLRFNHLVFSNVTNYVRVKF